MIEETVVRSSVWLGFALLGLLVGCSPDEPNIQSPAETTAIPSEEGYLEVEGGKIWYRTAGARGERTPLLLLHGGPGGGSRTLESLEALGKDRLVVFYDQLGAGRSDHPVDTSLWTIERHIMELNLVREKLGLEHVHVLGHSWGSMLLIEYLLTRPEGVVSATFASPLFSTARWIADAQERVKELPEDVQRVIEVHERAGTTDSAEYQEAVSLFYHRFLSRTDPWPESMNLEFQEFGAEVYKYMWGPSEFSATGTLSDWDRMDALPGLELPTLFTVGEFDETLPSTVQDYARSVPGARFEMIPNAAHITFVDAPDVCIDVVRKFLSDVEAGS
jgi:proline iminopeptidase